MRARTQYSSNSDAISLEAEKEETHNLNEFLVLKGKIKKTNEFNVGSCKHTLSSESLKIKDHHNILLEIYKHYS